MRQAGPGCEGVEVDLWWATANLTLAELNAFACPADDIHVLLSFLFHGTPQPLLTLLTLQSFPELATRRMLRPSFAMMQPKWRIQRLSSSWRTSSLTVKWRTRMSGLPLSRFDQPGTSSVIGTWVLRRLHRASSGAIKSTGCLNRTVVHIQNVAAG